MKKHLLLLCLLLGLVGTRASAYDFEVDGIYYNIISTTDLTCEVTSGDNEYSGYLEIPATVKSGSRTLDVVKIGKLAYSSCHNLISIIIPNSISSIEEGAFRNCGKLTSINIPNSVTNIGEEAFYSCESLKSFSIPSSVTTIGEDAFLGCEFKNLVIEDRTTYIDFGYTGIYYAYDKEESSVYIGMDCSEVENIVFKNFSHVTLGNNTKAINDGAFKWGNLISITIPNSVTSIGESAFSESSLKSINLPSSVETIEQCAFYDCYSLESINIPSKVSTLKNNTFYGCKKLKNLIIEDRTTKLKDEGDIYSSCIGQCPLEYIYVGGNYIFTHSNYLNTLKNLTYGSKVKKTSKISSSSLTSVHIPDGVESIGGFPYCTGLTSIEFPSSLHTIAEYSFRGCTGLTSITIPSKVASINSSLFEDCSNLQSITFEGDINVIGNYAFTNCTKLTHITLPNSVTSIGSGAFSGCTGFKSFIIPENVKAIGSKAFEGCSNLNCIVSYPTTPPTFSDDSFSQSQYATSIKVLVPEESLSAYTKADTWMNFWNIYPISFAFEPEELELFIGDSKNLTLTLPELSNSINWSSSNNEIATVENGIVTGISEGTVTITAQVGNYTATCAVTVNKKIIKATGITLSDASVVLEEGENIVLTATVTPNDVTDKTVSWSSNNTSVATVNNGVVKAISAGTATITAEIDDCIATCVITVTSKYVAVTGIKLNKESVEISEDGTIVLIATVTPDNATDKTVTWTSSNTNVAIVNDGMVTAVAPGTATITAKVGNYTAKCIVNVVKSFVLGDVNGDNLIVVDDVVFTINHVLGISSENFIAEAADMNGDGVILVDDVVQIINAVLGVNNVSTFATRSANHETWNVTCEANEQGENTLHIALDHSEDYVAMQFDMLLPAEVYLEDIQLTTDNNHSVAFHETEDGVIRVLITSLTNDAFTADNLLGINISTQAEAVISFSNAYVATVQGRMSVLADTEINVSRNGATSIQTISEGNAPADIYDLSGRLVRQKATSTEGLQRGIYLMEGKRIRVK